jgi:hypothetical protein
VIPTPAVHPGADCPQVAGTTPVPSDPAPRVTDS